MTRSRSDANQGEIIRAFRSCGFGVQPVSQYGGLGFDLLVDGHGHTFRVEVKDGNKPPSRRKLTKGEIARADYCMSESSVYVVVETVDDVVKVCDYVRTGGIKDLQQWSQVQLWQRFEREGVTE